MYVPSKLFFTKGVGVHKEKLYSFELALRDANISQYNLVAVSSIYPPGAKVVSIDKGNSYLRDGEIVHCVFSRNETNEMGRIISASVGVAIPIRGEGYDKLHGYLSEHHAYGWDQKRTGDYTEDLAAEMFTTLHAGKREVQRLDTLPLEYNKNKNEWNAMNGIIIKTSNMTSCAKGVDGLWTTVIACAILIP